MNNGLNQQRQWGPALQTSRGSKRQRSLTAYFSHGRIFRQNPWSCQIWIPADDGLLTISWISPPWKSDLKISEKHEEEALWHVANYGHSGFHCRRKFSIGCCCCCACRTLLFSSWHDIYCVQKMLKEQEAKRFNHIWFLRLAYNKCFPNKNLRKTWFSETIHTYFVGCPLSI